MSCDQDRDHFYFFSDILFQNLLLVNRIDWWVEILLNLTTAKLFVANLVG